LGHPARGVRGLSVRDAAITTQPNSSTGSRRAELSLSFRRTVVRVMDLSCHFPQLQSPWGFDVEGNLKTNIRLVTSLGRDFM
jgi:hypothetical protein